MTLIYYNNMVDNNTNKTKYNNNNKKNNKTTIMFFFFSWKKWVLILLMGLINSLQPWIQKICRKRQEERGDKKAQIYGRERGQVPVTSIDGMCMCPDGEGDEQRRA